jgi:phosphorylcholine metabolism protein LicD
MGGNPQKKELLNKTLVFITALLQQHVENWFIGYGTLLGVVRNGSCIDGDDDVDIVCSQEDNEKIIQLGKEHHINVSTIGSHFVRWDGGRFAPIDFYCADIKHDDFHDKHEKVVWKKCLPLVKKKWKGVMLQLPNDFLTKLKRRYGKTWKTPQKGFKGTRKRKTL